MKALSGLGWGWQARTVCSIRDHSGGPFPNQCWREVLQLQRGGRRRWALLGLSWFSPLSLGIASAPARKTTWIACCDCCPGSAPGLESGGPSEGIALKDKCPDKGLGTWTGRAWTQVSAVVWVFFTVAADACRAWPPSPRPGHPKGVRLKP